MRRLDSREERRYGPATLVIETDPGGPQRAALFVCCPSRRLERVATGRALLFFRPAGHLRTGPAPVVNLKAAGCLQIPPAPTTLPPPAARLLQQ